MLINATGRETLEEIGPEKYEKFTNNLVAAGYAGLEHHNGAHVLSCYLTKYKTKVSIFIASASSFLLIVMALITLFRVEARGLVTNHGGRSALWHDGHIP